MLCVEQNGRNACVIFYVRLSRLYTMLLRSLAGRAGPHDNKFASAASSLPGNNKAATSGTGGEDGVGVPVAGTGMERSIVAGEGCRPVLTVEMTGGSNSKRAHRAAGTPLRAPAFPTVSFPPSMMLKVCKCGWFLRCNQAVGTRCWCWSWTWSWL